MMRTIDKLRADGIKFRSLTEELDSESAQGRYSFRFTAPWQSTSWT